MLLEWIRYFLKALPFAIAILLWAVSGLVTISLFAELAGNEWDRRLIAFIWAGGLEAAKVVAWCRGGGYRLLALGLVGLTLFSAVGVAVSVVQATQRRNDLATRVEVQGQQLDLGAAMELQATIRTLNERLGDLPPDFVTAAANLTKDIERAQLRLASVREELRTTIPTEVRADPTGGLGQVATFLKVDLAALEIVVILIIAILTEASALGMASLTHPAESRIGSTPKKTASVPGEPTTAVPVSSEAYLRAALDHPGFPRLLGREKVAAQLGITEQQARKLLEELVHSGRIRRSTKSFQIVS